MTFLSNLFLYFIPAALIPLIISFLFSMNRKKTDFPSLELLEEIVLMQSPAKRWRMRLKQLLRMLIMICVITAFANPVFSPSNHFKNEYIVIIDPTISMARFDLPNIIKEIKSEYRVKKVFFGNGLLHDTGKIDIDSFIYQVEQFSSVVHEVVSREKPGYVILVSDGQKVNFSKSFKGLSDVKSLRMIILSNKARNIFVRSVSMFPLISIEDEKNKFDISIGGDIKNGDRVRALINGEVVMDEAARPNMQFSRFIHKKGIRFCRIELFGDEFTNDNQMIFPFVSAGRPTIYDNTGSQVVRRIITALFPEFQYTGNPKFADFVFATSLQSRITNKPVFLFPENMSTFMNTLRRDFSQVINVQTGIAKGKVRSRYPMLDIISDFSVKTRFSKPFGNILANVGNTPVVFGIDNYTICNFSLSENEVYLDDSVFLLLLVNETFSSYYRMKYILPPVEFHKATKKVFYNEQGLLVFPHKPGIYREKESGKYIVINVDKESDSRYVSKNTIENQLPAGAQISIWEEGKRDNIYGYLVFYRILIILSLALLLFDIFW